MAMKYNKSLLEKIIKEYECKIDLDKINFNKSIKDIQIVYECKCGKSNSKTTANIYKYGAYCSNCIKKQKAEKNNEKMKSNLEDFISKAKKVHNDKYDYSHIDKYTNNKTKIKIRCHIHNIFEQRPDDHLDGHGCKGCAAEKIKQVKQYSTEDFIAKATHKYKERYDYSFVKYIDCNTPVKIKCNICNKTFSTKPRYHLADNGGSCNYCNNQFSKSQIQWLEFLSKFYNITIKHALNGREFKIPNTNYPVDGYCEETNTVYEFHGDYWHGNPNIYNSNSFNKSNNRKFGELYDNTLKKENEITNMGYNLIVMWESKWKKINKSIKIIQMKFKSLKCIK